MFHSVQGEIWCLHRVLPHRSLIPSNRELEITPEYFENLIVSYKKDGFEFCSLHDIYDTKLPYFRFPFQKKFVNVSFDDGFCDIYTFAFPILKKHKVPFTIYLTTDFPDKKTIIWWVLLENIINDNDQITLKSGEKFNCKYKTEKIELYDLILHRIFTSNKNSVDEFKNLFSNYLADYKSKNEDLTLNWNQIIEMSEQGLCTIGSHSVTHPNLTKISDSDLRFELNQSIQIIEKKINKEVFHFSYPHSFWSHRVENEIKDTKLVTATMGYGGSIRWHDNKYKLPRKYIVQPQ